MTSTLDLWIVGIFFLIIFAIGVFERKKLTIDDYWVNSRKTKKLIIVATVASTYLGVGAIIANAGVAFSGGGLATFVLIASFFIYFLIFSKFFAPKIKEFGDAHNAYTLPDFLEHRYSKRTRVAGLIVNLLTYGFWLSLQILGIGIFVSSVSNINPNLATLIGGAIVVLYTTIGGLRADIRTDIFQFLVMLVLIFIFMPIIVAKSGGFEAIMQLPTAFLTGQEFAPWYVFLLSFLVIGASSIVTADLWQRAYAADSVKNVRSAFKIASIIVFLFLIMGTLMGLFGQVVVPDATSNTVIPELLKLYVPPFAFGLILAGFFAAIMSSADTVLLVMSMTLVHDLYQKTLNKSLAPEQVLRISRWTSFILGALAVVLAVTIFNVVHLAIDAVSFLVALLPAVIFGFYWRKATESAAFWSAIFGVLTVIAVLPFAPIYAFIPGIFVSFLVFFIVNKFARKPEQQFIQEHS
ncbi:MAG: Na+/proline symporter [Candidatus Jorgensenbacteria bacterium GW2011_GWA2_45_13]|uniref:Na+/proline symporter n=1 Tax=Candidatus Jorgensenbacteria bacterium GW2011_GWA2_45_13 TaxID=1618662 RepID=A0A0G1L432_9BACT|nr:MAG: Na+/proline symporter [Candidatus Jorgensenbacteria bacterium GW2011_GWA2_45_13]